jgi:hypothetical protein
MVPSPFHQLFHAEGFPIWSQSLDTRMRLNLSSRPNAPGRKRSVAGGSTHGSTDHGPSADQRRYGDAGSQTRARRLPGCDPSLLKVLCFYTFAEMTAS